MMKNDSKSKKDNRTSDDQVKSNSVLHMRSVRFILEKIKNDELGEILKDWKWILTYSKEYRTQIILFTILGVINTTFGLSSSLANKYMVDIVTGHNTDMLRFVVFIWVLTNALSIIISGLNTRFSGKIAISIRRNIQSDIFNRIMDSDWQALNKYTNGEMLDRLNGDSSEVANNAIVWLPNIVISVFNFIATLAVVWHYSKGMSLIAIGSAPILFFVGRWLVFQARGYQKENRDLSSKMYAYETESFSKIDSIKAMGLVDLFMERFIDKQDELQEFSLDRNMFQIKRSAILSALNMVITGVAFAYALWLIWTNQITYGTMVLFLEQRARLTQALLNVGQVIPNFVNGSVSAERVIEILNIPTEIHSQTEQEDIPSGGLKLVVGDIGFSYSDESPVIKGGSMTISPGEIVALVGPSGRGKTTLLRIILGLIYPQSGECALYDAEGKPLDVSADSRKYFSYVPQGNSLFSGTIRDNLLLMKSNASEEEMRKALEMADAWDFVKELPEGLDNPVWENGRGLSEGQAQRVAIARALIKDAPILLFDEATSALDIDTEARILANLKKMNDERAIIVTTHRPSVLDICNRVYRVRDGILEEISQRK